MKTMRYTIHTSDIFSRAIARMASLKNCQYEIRELIEVTLACLSLNPNYSHFSRSDMAHEFINVINVENQAEEDLVEYCVLQAALEIEQRLWLLGIYVDHFSEVVLEQILALDVIITIRRDDPHV